MVWIIAVACLALVGVIGFHQGPVRGLFSFFGLLFGAVLAGPLKGLAKPLLPLLGLHHPIWALFVPQAIAFVVVVAIFMIAGNAIHQKVVVDVKYEEDDSRYFVWRRFYSRLGFCVGLFNGAVYFLILMAPLYVGGYFAQAAQMASEGAPLAGGPKFLAHAREDLHGLRLDRLLGAYDPVPAEAYQAAGIAELVLHNPLLESRLSHYPPFLTLGERPEFKALGNDLQLQQMLQSQVPIAEVINYPSIQALLTNASVTEDIDALLGHNLDDLQQYLLTGQSAKYDPETILGSWVINPEATYAEIHKHSNLTPSHLLEARLRMASFVPGLTLVVTINQQFILRKQSPTSPEATDVGVGTWKKDGESYVVELPGSKPPTTEVEIQGGVRLYLPKDGDILVFDKE